jgi:hypothetical protein
VKCEEKVDISIASSYPHTHGIQFYKGLSAPDVFTRPDGAIIIFGPSATPIPDAFIDAFKRVRSEFGDHPTEEITAIMAKGMPFLPGESAEFNMAMSVAIRRPAIRTILVSPLVSPEMAAVLGLEYSSSINEGVETLYKAYPHARVAIFPSGGLIIPVI